MNNGVTYFYVLLLDAKMSCITEAEQPCGSKKGRGEVNTTEFYS